MLNQKSLFQKVISNIQRHTTNKKQCFVKQNKIQCNAINFLPLEVDTFRYTPCPVNSLLNISSLSAWLEGLQGPAVENRKFVMMWEVYWKILCWENNFNGQHDKNTLGWQKIKQALFLARHRVFNLKKVMCVRSWISSSFWWYSWHTPDMICASVFLCSSHCIGSQSGKEM